MSKCGWCNALGATKRCGRCRFVPYCGLECQKQAWREHKPICWPPPPPLPSESPFGPEFVVFSDPQYLLPREHSGIGTAGLPYVSPCSCHGRTSGIREARSADHHRLRGMDCYHFPRSLVEDARGHGAMSNVARKQLFGMLLIEGLRQAFVLDLVPANECAGPLGITTIQKYGLLQRLYKMELLTDQDIIRCVEDGPALTALVRKFESTAPRFITDKDPDFAEHQHIYQTEWVVFQRI